MLDTRREVTLAGEESARHMFEVASASSSVEFQEGTFTEMFGRCEDELKEFLRELCLVESVGGGTLGIEVLHLLIDQADGVRVDTDVVDDVQVVEGYGVCDNGTRLFLSS